MLGRYLWKGAEALSVIGGIVALYLALTSDQHVAIFALISLLTFLLLLALGVIQYVYVRGIRKFPKKYKTISTFMYYMTKDGTNISYEVIKHIQCKVPVLVKHDHKFSWSGTKEPKFSSDIQNVGEIEKGGEDEFDTVPFSFKKPIIYDDVAVVHIKAELDDSDGQSKPFLMTKVDEPVDFIYMKVMLLNKASGYSASASLTKKKISTDVDGPYKHLKSIPFDSSEKSYFVQLPDPDPGYFYKLEWAK